MKNINSKIILLISKNLNLDPKFITEKSSVNDFSKWDSLTHLRIMLDIEKQFKKKISTSKMNDLNTVSKIINFLNK